MNRRRIAVVASTVTAALAVCVCVLALGAVCAVDEVGESETQWLDSASAWTLRNGNGSIQVGAVVPGDQYSDLERAGVIGDPNYGYNEQSLRWVAEEEWVWTREFVQAVAAPRVQLLCLGLDTAAEVRINGMVVLQADNMFREYRVEVGSVLHGPGSRNNISVHFSSAVAYAAQMMARTPYTVPYSEYIVQYPNRNFVRKVSAHFGWDWGPAFSPAGIYRSIGLVPVHDVVIDRVLFRQHWLSESTVRVEVDVYTSASAQLADVPFSLSIEGTDIHVDEKVDVYPGEGIHTLSATTDSVVALWWPRGMGADKKPTLLEMQVQVGKHTHTKHVGFRNFRIVQDPAPEGGRTFKFNVNGHDVFAKGANYIQLDNFAGRLSEARYERVLGAARDVNMNVVRVWGGGNFEEDGFYDFCDRNGIMVWQEMMMACAMYPRDEAFLYNVRAEITDQLVRLGSHPSVVLWSGSNENEAALGGWYPQTHSLAKGGNPFLYVADYAALLDTVQHTVAAVDPSRPFWPSSPSNGVLEETPFVGRWGDVYSPHIGDVHFYNYTANLYHESVYPRARFVSEFGFQSWPSVSTLREIAKEEDLYVGSPVLEYRMRHPNGTRALMKQLAMHFGAVPSNVSLSEWVYLVQVQQAQIYSTAFQLWRRDRAKRAQTHGIIYWQLNDVWQAVSWSSLDYTGRWKLLHHTVRRVFASLLPSLHVDWMEGQVQLDIVNDLITPVEGGHSLLQVWHWPTASLAHNFSLSWRCDANRVCPAVTNISVSTLREVANQAPLHELLLLLDTDNDAAERQVLWLDEPMYARVPAAHVRVDSVAKHSPREFAVTVSSDTLAAHVQVLVDDVPGRFDDNGFVMTPGEKRTLTFVAFEDVSADSLQIRVHTLNEQLSRLHV